MAFMGMNPAQMRTFETSLDAEAKRVRAVISDLDGYAWPRWTGAGRTPASSSRRRGRRPAANWRSCGGLRAAAGDGQDQAFNRSARRLAEPAEHEITNQVLN